MKSIRVSLIVYFLSLLLLGLGGVSLLAYSSAADTLHEKEDNGRQLLDSEYQSREQDLRADLDQAILVKAKKVITRLARPYRVAWLNVLPIMSAPAAPMGYLNIAADLRLGTQPLSGKLTPAALRFLESRTLDQHVAGNDDVGPLDDGHPWEGCATFGVDGHTWERTTNLAIDPFELDEKVRDTAEEMVAVFDDLNYGSLELRRVTLKVRRSFMAPPPSGSPGKGGQRPQLPFAFLPRAMSEPWYFIQYATETGPLSQRLARLQEEHRERLSRLADETRTALSDLRRRLLFVCGLTALSVLIGGLILIWMGLSPLNRLSDAVSRINERDFQLQLDPKSLPTELQPVAERLRNSLDQLRRAFAREKQAAQDISHDLRTPLAALTTTLQVALKKDRSPAEYREMIEECKISASQMSHLVERLLALAKVDSGSNPIKLRPVDLVQTAQYAMDLVRPLAKARSIVMTLHGPDELPMLGDRDKLCEIFTNLLHNAVDYNRDAGTIDVMVAWQADFAEIRIADSGIGIQPDAMERLFERFYRADPSRASDTPHCGLGLAIVKSYVELMRGTISAESCVGQGTTFRIRLPYVGPPSDLDEANLPAPASEVFA